MTSSIINFIVDKYLSNILEINKEQTKSSIWKGEFEMSNLKIKPEIFTNLNLPYFELVNGYIGTLKIKLQFPRFYLYPIIVNIDKVFFHARQKKLEGLNEKIEIKNMELYKNSKLQNAEELMSQVNQFQNENSEPGMASKIINNLLINIKDIYIKYDDEISYPEKPFSFGILMKKLFIKTTDKNFTEIDDTTNTIPYNVVNYKIIELTNLSMFMDIYENKDQMPFEQYIIDNEKTIIDPSYETFINDIKDFYKYCLTETNIKIYDENAHSYLLFNLELTLKTALNDNLKIDPSPKASAYCELGEIKMALSLIQISVLMNLLSYINLNAMYQIGLANNFYKKKLTKNQQNAYVENYITYYELKYKKEKLNNKEAERMKIEDLQNIEDGLRYDTIQAMRDAALMKINHSNQKENIEKKITQLKGGSGFWSYFSSGPTEEQKKEIEKLEKELNELENNDEKINKEANDLIDNVKNDSEIDYLRDINDSFVLYKIEFKLPRCILKMPENDNIEMIDLEFKEFNIYCEIKKKGQFFGLYVDDLKISQYQLKDSVFKTLIETVEQKGDEEVNKDFNIVNKNENGSALAIEFINDPNAEKCDYKFIFKNKKRLIITLNLYSLQYFSSKIMTNLNTSIGKNDVIKYVQGEIGSYINKGMKFSEDLNQGNYNHFNIDLDIQIKSPLLLFPQNIIDEKNKDTILISFGDLNLFSNLPPKKKKDINYIQFNDIDKKSIMYDLYSFEGNNFYMSTIKNYDGRVENLTLLKGLYLLENITLNFKMYNIIEPQNKFFENFKIEITISDVNFNLTDSQMIFFIDLLDSLSRINKKLEYDLLSDLKFNDEEKKEEEKKEEEKKEEEKKEEEKNEEEKKEEKEKKEKEKVEKKKKEDEDKKRDKPTFIFDFILTKVKFTILKTITYKEKELLLSSSDEIIHNKEYKEYLSFSMAQLSTNVTITEKSNMNVLLSIKSINMNDVEVEYLSEKDNFKGEPLLYPSFQKMIGTESEIDKEGLLRKSFSRINSMNNDNIINLDLDEISTSKKNGINLDKDIDNAFITIIYNYLSLEKKQFVTMDMQKLKLCFPLPTLAKLYQFYQYYFGIYSKKMKKLEKFLNSQDLIIEKFKNKKKKHSNEEEEEKEDEKEIILDNEKIIDDDDNEISTSKKPLPKKKNLFENTKFLKNIQNKAKKDNNAKKTFINNLKINIQDQISKTENSNMFIEINMKEIEMSMPMEAEKDDTKVLLFKFNFMCKINMKSEYVTIINEFKEIERIDYHYNDMKISAKIFNIDFCILNFIRGHYIKPGLCEKMISDFRFLTNIKSFLDFENERNVMRINVNFEPMTINIGFRQIKTLQNFLTILTQFSKNMNLPYEDPIMTYDDNSLISKKSTKINTKSGSLDNISDTNSLGDVSLNRDSSIVNSSINESTINQNKENEEKEIIYNTSKFHSLMDLICTIDKTSMRFLDNTTQYISPLLNIEMNKTSFKYISNSNPKGTKNIGFVIIESVSQNEIPLKDYDPYNLYQYVNANFSMEINFYNDKKNDWEPIIEKWTGEFLINQFASFTRYRCDLISNDMLNVNFSIDSVRVFNNVMKKFYQNEEDWDSLDKRKKNNIGSNAAIEVFNFTGMDVSFWLDADEKNENGINKIIKYQITNNSSHKYYKNDIGDLYKKMDESELKFKKDKFSFQFEGYSVINSNDYSSNYVKSFIIMKEKEIFNDARSIRTGIKINKKKVVEEKKKEESKFKNERLIEDDNINENNNIQNVYTKLSKIKEEEEDDEINTDSIQKPLINKEENKKNNKDDIEHNNNNKNKEESILDDSLQVLVKVYQNGLTKTIILESNISFYNNLQYPIILSLIPRDIFMLDYRLNENNIDHSNNQNKIIIEPNNQKSIPLNLIKNQSRIYAKLNDDNMSEINTDKYTLIYDNFDFMKNELTNLTCYDILSDVPLVNVEGLLINIRNKSSKILPLKKDNEDYFVSIDFTVNKGINEKIKNFNTIINENKNNNNNDLYKDRIYNTYSYMFIIGQCFILENQIPYDIKIDLLNDLKTKSINLHPLDIKNVFDINPLEGENGKIKLNFKYHNEDFISDEINVINDDDVKIQLKNKNNEIIDCKIKKDENFSLISVYDEKGLMKIVKNFTKRKKLIFYFEYIFNNKTNENILIKDQSINENNFIETISNKIIPKDISCFNINSNAANFKIENSTWTKKTTLNTIGMSGELIFESKIENDNKNTLIKNLALLISSSSKFKNSFIITIEPRFMLVNKLPIDILFKQYDINNKDNEGLFELHSLKKGEMQEFKYIQTEKKMKKYIRIKSENEDQFSCPFNIEEISDINIKIPINDDLVTSIKNYNEEIKIRQEEIKKEKEEIEDEILFNNTMDLTQIKERKNELEKEEKLLNQHIIYKIQNINYLLIKTSIATYDNGLIYLIFYSPKYSEYLISNETNERIEIKQKKDKFSQDLIIMNGTSEEPFVWGDLSDDEKSIILKIRNQEFEIDFSKIEKVDKKIDKDLFTFEIIIENSKRRKLIITSDKVKNKKKVTKSFYKSLIKTSDKKNLTTKFIINMKGFGLSIIDNSPKEIFYISIYNLFLKYHTLSFKRKEEINKQSITNIILMMKNFQIDYCLEDSFKSIIVPKNRINPDIEESLSDKEKLEFIPFFQLLLSINTSENTKTNEITTKYPQFDFTMQEILIYVDQACIFTLLSLQNQLLDQLDFYKTKEIENHNKSINDNLPSKYDKNLSTEIELPENLIITSENQSKIFMNYLFLSSIKLTITLRIDLSSLELGNLPGIVHKLIAAFGNSLAKISDCTLRFSEMVYTNVFTDVYSLSSLIQKHYTRQGMLQFYKVIGSLDIIGNPISFVDKVGTGFFEFFNEPRKGFLKGPVGFGEGIAKGVYSLISNVIGGGFDVVGKITGTFLNFTQTLQGEKNIIQEKEPENFIDGMYKGVKGGIIDIGKGVLGVFKNPYVGFKNEGVKGIFKGIGSGILGVAVSPFSAVFRISNNLFVGLKNTANIFNDKIKSGRFRFPRPIEKSSALKCYDKEKAKIKAILNYLENYDDEEIIHFRYFKFKNGGYDRSESVLILTNRNILVVFEEKEVVFEINLKVIVGVEVHDENLKEGNNNGDRTFTLLFILPEEERKYIATGDYELCREFYSFLIVNIRG